VDEPAFEAPIVEGAAGDEVMPCEDEPVVADGMAPPAFGCGCIAGEPDEVVPEPVAAGRSVAPEGAVPDVWARAGMAAKAVATRQAAICFFSIRIS
jgi:hypothetical protein